MAHILLETTAEFRNILLLQRQTYRIGMSTKVLQQITTRLDGIVDIETSHTTSRTRCNAVDDGENNGRTEIELRQTRGNDTHYAFLPTFVVEHDRFLMFLTLQTCHDFVGLFGHLLIDIASLVVVFVDTGSNSQSLLKVTLNQQLYCFHTILHTSRGIDAGADFEHDIAHGELTPRQSAYLDDGFQTYRATLVKLFQTVESQDTVFALYRYQIGCYRYGTEVE